MEDKKDSLCNSPSNWVVGYSHRRGQVKINGVFVEYSCETKVTQTRNSEKWFGRGGNN
jgi:hypothetical protein